MKTTKKHFETFIAEVKRLMDKWELNNWQVAFEHKKMNTCNAKIRPQLCNYKASFAFSTDNDFDYVNHGCNKTEYIKRIAMHEVIHLLLSRLSVVGQSRYITDAELEEAEEELVHKIMHILSIHNQKQC